MAYNKSEVLQNRTVTAKMFSGPQNDFQREVRIPSGMWKRMWGGVVWWQYGPITSPAWPAMRTPGQRGWRAAAGQPCWCCQKRRRCSGRMTNPLETRFLRHGRFVLWPAHGTPIYGTQSGKRKYKCTNDRKWSLWGEMESIQRWFMLAGLRFLDGD